MNNILYLCIVIKTNTIMTIFEVAARREYAWKQNLANMTAYQPFTTFYSDFTLAELVSGVSGVKDTYKRAFNSWKSDYKYLTELTMVLNHKIWEHYENNVLLAQVYNDLWQELDIWCKDNLKGEELHYFYEVLD